MKIIQVALEKQRYDLAAHVLVYSALHVLAANNHHAANTNPGNFRIVPRIRGVERQKEAKNCHPQNIHLSPGH